VFVLLLKHSVILKALVPRPSFFIFSPKHRGWGGPTFGVFLCPAFKKITFNDILILNVSLLMPF